MLFNSIQFLIFFPVVTALYFLCPYRFRHFLLLVASVYFYMAFVPKYVVILFILILVDYFAALFIERTSGYTKKLFLIISILSTCAALFFFKYYNFFVGNIFGPLHILLPI